MRSVLRQWNDSRRREPPLIHLRRVPLDFRERLVAGDAHDLMRGRTRLEETDDCRLPHPRRGQAFRQAGLRCTVHEPVVERGGRRERRAQFGHQERHQAVSRKPFDLSWRRHIDDEKPVIATGFSCRCQSERLAGRDIQHPLGLVAAVLRR